MKFSNLSRVVAFGPLLLALAAGCPSETNPCNDGASCVEDAGDHGDAGTNPQTDSGNPGVDAGTATDGSVPQSDAASIDAGSPDAAVCVPTGATDEPDVDRTDANCDGIDGDVASAIFVAPSPVGSDVNDGTMAHPLATIGHAISVASAAAKSQLIIAEGTYAESVVMIQAISLHGGYRVAPTWTRPSGARTVVMADSPALVADTIVPMTRVSVMTIRSNDGTTPGAGSIGVLIRNSTGLVLEDVIVEAGDGAAGTAGVTAGRPAQATSGGMGGAGGYSLNCTTPSVNVLSGPAGSGGNQASAAPYCNRGGNGQSYSVAAQLGTSGATTTLANTCAGGTAVTPVGQTGALGARGPDGTPGAGIGVITATGYAGSSGGSGVVGVMGSGGGGGAKGADVIPVGPPGSGFEFCIAYGASGGGGGAGGLGGIGGPGGMGGGASIALLAWNSQVQLVRVLLDAGNGGQGGNGATGGLGGLGGAPGPGGVGSNIPPVWSGNPGNPGGAGGEGGPGGGGGGGGGGPSISLVLGGGATVQSMSLVRLRSGTAGAGGAAGGAANTGATGDVQSVLTLP